MQKNTRIIMVFFIMFLSVISIVCSDFVIDHFKTDNQKMAELKARSAVHVIAPILNDAITSSDDITLLDSVKAIASIDSVTSCFIVDDNNRVVIHNDLKQIDTVRDGNLYLNAVKKGIELVQLTSDPNLFLYSYPLSGDRTLFCIVSTQSDSSSFLHDKVEYYFICAIFIALISIFLFMMLKDFVISPFSHLKKVLVQKVNDNFKQIKSSAQVQTLNTNNSIISKFIGTLKEFISLNPQEQYKDILNIFIHSNEDSTMKINNLSNRAKGLYGLVEHYGNMQKTAKSVFIALDALHNVIFAYDKTGKILKNDVPEGANIIEIISDTRVLDILNKASETANTKYETTIDNLTLSAISIYNEMEISGIIISG
jgi:hypothetical protein